MKLGEFSLSGIPPLPPGQGEIDETFELDVNGILRVSAVVCANGKKNSVTISQRNGKYIYMYTCIYNLYNNSKTFSTSLI